VKLLPDTHILLWLAIGSDRLSQSTGDLLTDRANEVAFSTASIWEIAIKTARGRSSFEVDPQAVRTGLIENGYCELPITGPHAIEAAALPPIHNDPFDRLLVAQARIEDLLLLTVDRTVAAYAGPIRLV
jgi:PIN domain nuclease of toxin-antitoxin system